MPELIVYRRWPIEIKPGVRVTWKLGRTWQEQHEPPPTGWPNLDVIVRREGYEELWRNVVSATLDKELWPELSSTPILVRAWMKVVKAIPFIGCRLWKSIIELVLKAQILMMFKRYKYVVWCGHVPLTDWWPTPLWEREPQWVQTAEWDSADFCNKIATSAAEVIGRTVLGLSNGYPEYYVSHTIVTKPEKSHG